MNSKKIGLTLGVVALVTMGMSQDLNNVIHNAETMQSSQSIGEAGLYEYSVNVNKNHAFVNLAEKAVKEVTAAAKVQIEAKVSEVIQLSEDAKQDSVVATASIEPIKKDTTKTIVHKVVAVPEETKPALGHQIEEVVSEQEEPSVVVEKEIFVAEEENNVAEAKETTVNLSTLSKEEATLESIVELEEAKIAQTVKVAAPEKESVTRWAKTNINIRTGAGLDHPVIGVASIGTELKGKVNGDWFEFSYDEEVCFVSAKYLSDVKIEIEESAAPQPPEVVEEQEAVSETKVSGWVTTSLNIRKQPNTQSEIIGSFVKGTLVEGIESDGWIKVNYNEDVAYISAGYLSDTEIKKEAVAEEVVAEVKEKSVTRWLTTSLNVRKGPGTENEILGVLPKGTKVEGVFADSWLKISYQDTIGYVSGKYLSENEIEKAVVETKKEETKTEAESKAGQKSGSTIDNIVDAAWSFVGYPYVYGAHSPEKGFDCSGLTYYLYKEHAGITLNRVSGAQMSNGYSVSKDTLQRGDLVFFTSDGNSRVGHVGIYVGDGKFVHASTPATGVKVNSVNENYYARNFAGARRIID